MRSWFTHLWALHLLWLFPVLTLLGALAWRRRQRALAHLGRLALVRATNTGGITLRLARSVCAGLSLLGVALAVGGPRWGRDYEQTLAPGRDLVVVLDLSRSMLARDLLPNRLETAREALFELSEAVERRGGHRLALVVFAARARVACPLTHDYEHFRLAVAEQDAFQPHPDIRPEGESSLSGTRLGKALTLAADLHEERLRGYQDILLLSDGDDPARDGEWRVGAEAARKLGIPVHVIGIGDPETRTTVPGRGDEPLLHEGKPILTRLEEADLQEIARWTRGTYTPGRTQTLRLGELFHERIDRAAAREDGEDALMVQRPRHAWFFAAALALLTLEMLMGRRAGKPIQTARPNQNDGSHGRAQLSPRPAIAVVALCCLLVSAAPLSDWETQVQRATQAFEAEDYAAALRHCEQAEEQTTDPGLVAFNKAAALYQLGLAEGDAVRRRERFKEAERHYRFCLDDARGQRRARALFDLGNALLQQAGDRETRLLEQAIAAYEQCLREPAAHELLDDVRHNLELAKVLWLRARAKRAQANADTEPPEPDAPPPESRQEPGSSRLDSTAKQGLHDKARPGKHRPGNLAQGNAATSQMAPPGKGNTPPLPDEDELATLSPEETAEYLRQALERMEHERTEHLRRTFVAPSRKLKDW